MTAKTFSISAWYPRGSPSWLESHDQLALALVLRLADLGRRGPFFLEPVDLSLGELHQFFELLAGPSQKLDFKDARKQVGGMGSPHLRRKLPVVHERAE